MTDDAQPTPDAGALVEELALPADPGGFADDEVEGLPEPVQRYLRAAIASTTPLARAAELTMEGRIKLGERWLPWKATEVLAPHVGFVWAGSVLRLLKGSDLFADGVGVMDWRVLGRWPVVEASGDDVSRSGAGRGAAEGIWVPTALLPRFGVRWEALDAHHLVARYAMGDVDVELHLHVADDGRLLRFHFDRWGDPDESGTFRLVPFGGDALAWERFDGVTIPSEGRVGWWYGSPRFHEGEFFRYRITGVELVR